MSGVQELPAVISPVGVIAAKLTTTTDRPRYPGPYDVTPAADAQELATKGLVMDSDVTVGGMGEAVEKAEKAALSNFVDGKYVGVYRDEELTETRHGCLWRQPYLTAIELPNVTRVNGSLASYDTALTRISLPSLTNINVDPNEPFANNCTSLTDVDLPNLCICAAQGFLCGATSLKSISLPLLQWQPWGGFEGCSSLERVEFGNCHNMQSGWTGCVSLTTLINRYSAVCRMTYTNIFRDTPIANGTGYVYVPRALVDSYKTATNWSVYADQIRAIEDYPEICDPE